MQSDSEASSSNSSANPSSTSPQTIAHLSNTPWKEEFLRSSQKLGEFTEAIKLSQKTSVEAPTLRVNQLDAIILDNELYEIFKSQFQRVFMFFKEDFTDRFKPELEGSLKYLIFHLSILSRNFSYGQQLQNLTFPPLSLAQKSFYLIFTIILPYGLQRWWVFYTYLAKLLFQHEAENSPSPSTIRRIHFLEKLYQLANTINFLIFLWNGSYVSLVHRILGLKQIYLRKQMSRRVAFEYMNRQLIWNGFTEFMLFIMPMIPVKRITRGVSRAVTSVSKLIGLGTTLTQTNQVYDSTICPICSSKITTPYKTNCNHNYCYYCIKVAVMTELRPPCQICSEPITKISRLNM